MADVLAKPTASALRRFSLPASGRPARLEVREERSEVPLARAGARETSSAELAARLSVLLRWS